MITAAAYILKVPEHRREILLEHYGGGWFFDGEAPAGEPVPRFEHSRRAPLVVFACFADDAITHIADGRKGNGAGRGLVVLNMRSIQPLDRPIAFSELRVGAPARIRTHLDRILTSGGKLPPKSLGAVVDPAKFRESALCPFTKLQRQKWSATGTSPRPRTCQA